MGPLEDAGASRSRADHIVSRASAKLDPTTAGLP
jgi:hypothetical protein